jgi:hypothetical protein
MVPMDLSTIFTGYGPLPAVTGVVDQTGPWDHVGVNRRPVLSDGTTAYEEVTVYEPPTYFAYEVSQFENVLNRFVIGARGDLRFTPTDDGRTELVWTYAFLPRPRRRAFVALAIAPLWRRYMRHGLARAIEQIESEA